MTIFFYSFHTLQYSVAVCDTGGYLSPQVRGGPAHMSLVGVWRSP